MAEMLDKTDIQILRVLQKNARITVKDLALKVHLSPTPVFERLHRLENDGYIRKYTAVLDAAKLGRGFLVFCCVRLRRIGKEIANDFVNRLPPEDLRPRYAVLQRLSNQHPRNDRQPRVRPKLLRDE